MGRAQEVQCLGGMGLAYLRDRRFDQARDYFEQALAVAQDVGDTFWTVTSMGNLAETLFKNGQLAEAERLLRQTLAQVPAHYSGYLKGHVIRILALVECAQGRYDDALATAQEALETIRSSGNANYEAGAESTLGVVLTAMGRAQEALEPLQHSASLQRRRGDRAFEAEALDATGEAYLALDRPEEAADFHRRAAALYRGLADDWNTAVALAHLADAIEAAGGGVVCRMRPRREARRSPCSPLSTTRRHKRCASHSLRAWPIKAEDRSGASSAAKLATMPAPCGSRTIATSAFCGPPDRARPAETTLGNGGRTSAHRSSDE